MNLSATPLPAHEEQECEPLSPVSAVVPPGRHRQHRFPARGHALKVLYGDDEWSAVQQAAALSGLRPSSYVAAAALAMARQVAGDGPGSSSTLGQAGGARAASTRALRPAQDRELLAELMRSRVAVRRFGTNVNQAVAALNSGQRPPVWLERAVVGCERAVARLDEAAAAVARRLA